jgi:hypothetical protein
MLFGLPIVGTIVYRRRFSAVDRASPACAPVACLARTCSRRPNQPLAELPLHDQVERTERHFSGRHLSGRGGVRLVRRSNHDREENPSDIGPSRQRNGRDYDPHLGQRTGRRLHPMRPAQPEFADQMHARRLVKPIEAKVRGYLAARFLVLRAEDVAPAGTRWRFPH